MKQKKSLLTQAVLASTVFCLYSGASFAWSIVPFPAGVTSVGNTGYEFITPSTTLFVAPLETIGGIISPFTFAFESIVNDPGSAFCGVGGCLNTTVDFLGGSIVTGLVGNVNPIGLIQLEPFASVLFNGTVAANTFNFNGTNATLAAFSNGANLTTTVTTSFNDTGRLAFNGTSTVSATIGSGGLALYDVIVQGAGSTVLFNGNIFVGTGGFVFNNPVSSTASLANGVTITGNVVTTNDNTGVLQFLGNGAVTGTIGAGGLRVNQINLAGAGSNVNFQSNIFVGTGNFLFNNAASNTATFTNPITLTGNVETNFLSTGKMVFNNGGAVTGTIGALTALAEIDVQGAGSNLLFSKSVSLSNAIGTGALIFNGTANATTTAEFADGANLTGKIATISNNVGTVKFDGSSTVSGDVGAAGLAVNKIDLTGGAGKTVAFAGNIFVGTGSLLFDNAGGPTATIADGKTITGTVDSANAGTGNLHFLGGGTATGNIGAGNKINNLVANFNNGASKTVELQGAIINANNIHLGDDGATASTIKLNNPTMVVTSPFTVQTHDKNTLDIFNAATINGQIGTLAKSFHLIKVGANNDITLNGNVFSTLTQFQGNKTLNLATGNTITGAVDTTVANTGTLLLQGVGEVTGAVGAVNKLAAVTLTGTAGQTGTFDSTVNATTININGAGGIGLFKGAVTATNVNIKGLGSTGTFQDFVNATNVNIQDAGNVGNFLKTLTGDLYFTDTATAASTANFSDLANMNGNIDNLSNTPNVGTVNFLGASIVTGTVGATSGIFALNINSTKTVTFQSNIYNDSHIVFNADGFAKINPNLTINANVDSSIAGNGTLQFLGPGTTTMNGKIGPTNGLKQVDVFGIGTVVNFNDDVLNATPIILQDNDEIINFANGVTVDGNIDNSAGAAKTGTVQFIGNATVNGVMGPVNGLKSLNILGGPGTLVTFNNDILNNTPIWYFDNGTVSIADGKTIADVLNQTGQVAGTLIFQGGGTVEDIAGPTPITPLELVTVNANGGVKTLNFIGPNINVNTINVVGGGGNATTLNFNSATGTNQSGNITTNNNGLDIITLNSVGNSVFNGQIGTASNHFAALNLLQANSTLKVIGDIYADQIQLNAANTTLQIDDGSPFGPITTNAPNQGTVTFLGTSTVDFAVGTIANPIDAFNVNGFPGSVVSLNASVFADDFSVNNGGTLRPISGNTVTATPVDINNGILQITNNSTFNVNGDLNLNNANAILQVDMAHNLTTTGEVFVTGTASVKAPASLSILNPAFSPNGPTVIPIVMAGVGDFAPAMNITNPNSFLTTFATSVTNGGNTLNLIITSQALANVADQPNTIGVGGALDQIASSGVPISGSLENIIEQLNSFDNAQEVNYALSTLAPIVDGAILNESFMAQRQIFDAIGLRFDRMRFWEKHHFVDNDTGLSSGDEGDQYGAFVKVIRQHANQKERQRVEGYHEDMVGLVIGGDTLIRDDLMVGAALSWTNLNMHDKIVNRYNTTVNSYQATVYASLECDTPWYFDGYAALGFNDYVVNRNIIFGEVNLFPRGEFNGWQAGAKGEVGYIYDFGSTHVVPIASLFYSHLNIDSYQETGADTANQVIQGSDFDALLGGVGVQLINDYAYDTQRVFQAQAHMMLYYDFIGDRMQLTSQFVGAGPSFNTLGFTPAKTSLNLGGHISLFSTNNWIFTVSYDFDVKEDYTANAGFVRIKHEW